MNKNYVVALLALLFSSCSLAPTTRIHSAASIPRIVDVNTSSFREEDSKNPKLQGNGGIGYGLAWTDSGNIAGSEIYYAGINFRSSRLAFGWTPFLGKAQVSVEGTGMFGSMLWYAIHFGGGSKWRFSYQNTYTLANESAEDTGCSGGISGIFGASCQNGQVSTARSQVRIEDLGFVFTVERRLGSLDSLIIAPAVYWTSIASGNQLDSDPSGNYVYRTAFWSPGLMVGYHSRLSEYSNADKTLMAGAQWIKTFRPDWAVRQLMPSADLRISF